uniref:Uncharacterized protein n=1 Tax=Salix viminalis TaxID=40686 RepID=A0A6N2LJ99_SALVM
MSVVERSSSTSAPVRETDPLLKDLNEKKQSFRKNVVSLAAELKEVRNRLASQEQSFAKETETRHDAENKARIMEEEISRLQERLEERNGQLQVSASTADKITTCSHSSNCGGKCCLSSVSTASMFSTDKRIGCKE